jgi:flagellar biosynthesis protein
MAGKDNNKTKQAIALGYNPDEEAPKIIATGKGIIAERILEKAKESNVPIHRDDKLADTLSRLDIGDMIPPELYEVVAEILVFVDAIDKLKGKQLTR